MRDLSFIYILDILLGLVAGGAILLYWIANRKRIAAETVGRAQEQAAQHPARIGAGRRGAAQGSGPRRQGEGP